MLFAGTAVLGVVAFAVGLAPAAAARRARARGAPEARLLARASRTTAASPWCSWRAASRRSSTSPTRRCCRSRVTDTHGLDPSVWGALLVVNPLMVTLLQLRITARLSRRPRGPQAGRRHADDGPAVPACSSETAAIPLLVGVHRDLRARRDAVGPGDAVARPCASRPTTCVAPTSAPPARRSRWRSRSGPLIGLSVRDAQRRRGDVGSSWPALSVVRGGDLRRRCARGGQLESERGGPSRRAHPLPSSRRPTSRRCRSG